MLVDAYLVSGTLRRSVPFEQKFREDVVLNQTDTQDFRKIRLPDLRRNHGNLFLYLIVAETGRQ